MVYIIKWKSSNKRLWVRNYKVRDNSVLKTGSYLKILNPLPMLNSSGNVILIIECRRVAVKIDPPRMVHSVHADFVLVKNNTGYFVFKN